MLEFHGFTKLEAKVYIKLLESGQCKVSELGKLTGITRTQLYPLLEKMLEKGYIREVGTKPVKYEALEPKELVRHLEENNLKRIETLSKLEEELEKISSTELVSEAHKIYLIKEKTNVIRKLAELLEKSKKEIVLTVPFENNIFEKSKKLMKLLKAKARELKVTVYFSTSPENFYRIEEIEKFGNVSFEGIVKEKPHVTAVFDNKYVMVVFFAPHKKDYETAFYFENEELAKIFALKASAPIESYPLEGELRLKTIGGERALIIPPIIDVISKLEQYKLGYGVGWYGIKSFGEHKCSLKTLLLMLKMQMMINGWGKVKITSRKNEEGTITVEKSIVPGEFIKGNIEGFLSVLGNFEVKEKIFDEKKKKYAFSIKIKK